MGKDVDQASDVPQCLCARWQRFTKQTTAARGKRQRGQLRTFCPSSKVNLSFNFTRMLAKQDAVPAPRGALNNL